VSATTRNPWWRGSVVYQIYPRSFAEGRPARGAIADGVGDLRGICEHLDHVEWLGVDAIWLSPVFTSPMADFGYDVADYCDVDPVFGTLADLDDLVAACHARGLKVLLDWVPNHTSTAHPWFVESRSSRTNAKADWYVWCDEPPNNWKASFPRGDDAWQWDEVRGQYYLRSFTVEQADLDWNNPDVEAAMLDTLRFWLDRGVDGFRMDVIHMIGKDLHQQDPDGAVARAWSHVPYNDVEITHERLRRIRAVLDSYPGDRVAVGEVYLLDEAAVARYYGDDDELHLNFNFSFLWAPASPPELRARIRRTLDVLEPLGACPTWVLSNHDVPRHRGRHGGDERVARMMAVMLLTLPGTTFLYQGEELGMIDADIPDDRVVDPGRRDGCRSPIPWTGDDLHGWYAPTWLPFGAEAPERNVAALRGDPDSILQLYHDVLHLRRHADDLVDGSFELVELEPADTVLAYRRGERWWVVLNLGDEPVELPETVEVAVATVAAMAGARIDAIPARTAVIARR
jgi:alpha-glucosidase